jgi:putative solute:sodium symporter small subunit
MRSIYRRECWVTLIAFAVATLLTHIFPVYFLFPAMVEFTIFGFPAHYLMTMVVGWLVLVPAYWFYMRISEKIDLEISEYEEREYEERDETVAPATLPSGAEAAGGRR